MTDKKTAKKARTIQKKRRRTVPASDPNPLPLSAAVEGLPGVDVGPAPPLPGIDPFDIDKGSGDPRAPRFFSDAALQAAVDRSLEHLARKGRRVAVLGVVNKNQAALVGVCRLGDGWTIQGVFSREMKSGKTKAEAIVRWTPDW